MRTLAMISASPMPMNLEAQYFSSPCPLAGEKKLMHPLQAIRRNGEPHEDTV